MFSISSNIYLNLLIKHVSKKLDWEGIYFMGSFNTFMCIENSWFFNIWHQNVKIEENN